MELSEELVSLERRMWDANVAGDGGYYDRMLGDDAVAVSPWGVLDKAAVVAGVTANRRPYLGYELDQERCVRVGADGAVLTYRAVVRAEGFGHTVYATSVYERSGGGWRGVFHQQSLLADQTIVSQG
jgi:hypothetical protein